MTGTMRAVVKTDYAPGHIELRTVPIPQIGPREILVRVKAAAVCGTDVHIRHWNAWAQARMNPPVVIGHEFSGEVVATGSPPSPTSPATPVRSATRATATSAPIRSASASIRTAALRNTSPSRRKSPSSTTTPPSPGSS